MTAGSNPSLSNKHFTPSPWTPPALTYIHHHYRQRNNLCQSTFCSESDTFFAKAEGLEFSALKGGKGSPSALWHFYLWNKADLRRVSGAEQKHSLLTARVKHCPVWSPNGRVTVACWLSICPETSLMSNSMQTLTKVLHM